MRSNQFHPGRPTLLILGLFVLLSSFAPKPPGAATVKEYLKTYTTYGFSDPDPIPAFNSIPTWGWFGGVFAGLYLVASLIAIPKLGAAAVFSLVVAGQMVAALILDSTGAFGVAQISLSPFRVAGAALLVIGVILIQKP